MSCCGIGTAREGIGQSRTTGDYGAGTIRQWPVLAFAESKPILGTLQGSEFQVWHEARPFAWEHGGNCDSNLTRGTKISSVYVERPPIDGVLSLLARD